MTTTAAPRSNREICLATLRDTIVRCIHELVVNKVPYELREVRVQTALTDRTGQLLKTIAVAACGTETHDIGDAERVPDMPLRRGERRNLFRGQAGRVAGRFDGQRLDAPHQFVFGHRPR